MTMIGTFQAGRKGFPAELKVPETPFSSTIFYEKGGPLSLTQYRVKSIMSKGKVIHELSNDLNSLGHLVVDLLLHFTLTIYRYLRSNS